MQSVAAARLVALPYVPLAHSSAADAPPTPDERAEPQARVRRRECKVQCAQDGGLDSTTKKKTKKQNTKNKF